MGNVGTNELALEERRLPLRDLAPPAPGVAHLWLLDLAELGSPLQPEEEVRPEDLPVRQRRTLRRFYLRLLLGAYLGLPGKDVQVLRSERGKPRLDPSVHAMNLDFSMAASLGRCLVAVTTGAVIGVDLEPRGRRAGNPLGLARRYFSPAERRGLEALAPEVLDRAFLRTWACKEAVVKAGGTGIANALCRFTVNVDPDQPAAVEAMEDDAAGAWQLRCVGLPDDLLAAITVRSPTLELSGYRLAPP